MCICRVHVQALTRFLFRGSVLALFTLRSMSYGEYVGQQSHEQTPPRAPAATAPPPSEPGYATAPGHRPTPAPSPSTPPMWASGQTAEEDDVEDAPAMMSPCCGHDWEWEHVELVRANRELLGNLDGWSCDALAYLYNFLRYDMGVSQHFNRSQYVPPFKAPPLLPRCKAPPPRPPLLS